MHSKSLLDQEHRTGDVMIVDYDILKSPGSQALTAVTLAVAVIDLLQSSDKVAREVVEDALRNAQALLPQSGEAAAEARQFFECIRA